jgi:hypothetical protein
MDIERSYFDIITKTEHGIHLIVKRKIDHPHEK